MTNPNDVTRGQPANGDIAATDHARDWVLRLASGDIDEAEMQAFKAWLAEGAGNRAAFDRERRFWHRLGGLDRVSVRRRPAGAWRGRAAAGLALAACLALFAVLGGGLPGFSAADFETVQGAQDRVVLADGSVMHMNTDTAVRVGFTDGERRVELLRGEALFEVKPDNTRPFRVAAGGGVTEAVGTAFAVRTDGDGATTVTVTEGVVNVTAPIGGNNPAGGSVRLVKGQGTVYVPGQAPTAAVATDTALAWRRGLIRIDGLPLDAAVAELDRYLPGRIVLLAGSAGMQPVSGVFDMDKVDAAVQGLAATHGLRVTRITRFLTVLR
jgi:transmembrane sensor